MFATDADFQIRFDAAAAFGPEPHQFTNPFTIENLKRIVAEDLAIDVRGQKTTRIVAAQTKGCLRKIVCAE